MTGPQPPQPPLAQGASPRRRAAADERRGAIDLARVLSLALVVAGHLTLAVIDRGPDGAVRGANLLALRPGWAWLTVVAPMPVFFAAAGWANAHASITSAVPRLRDLVSVATVVVAVWFVPAAIEHLIVGHRGVLGNGARIATQPLWFLAAYVPFAALGSTLARWAARPVLAVGWCLVVLGVLDMVRFGAGGSSAWGWPGFWFAWAVPWLLGAWWRTGHPSRVQQELLTGAALAVGGIAAGAVLVRWGGYTAALIDAVPGRRSNTTPPTLFTACAGIAQVGVLMMSAAALDRLARRIRRFLARAGGVAAGVYLWHLTALALCAGVFSLGLPSAVRLTPQWWLTRPLWWAAVLAVTAALVAATARVTARPRSTPPAVAGSSRPTSLPALWCGVLLVTIASATVGLIGPRTASVALGCVALFAAGWWCLSAPSWGHGPRRQRGGTSTGRPHHE